MKVELIDYMGSDLSVVNAARVSFDKQSDWAYADETFGPLIAQAKWDQERELSVKDERLIQFLARGMTTADFDAFIADVGSSYADSDDAKLIDLLWQWRRNPTHFTPFAHPHVTFRCKAPIFVARQLEKHQVGFTWSEVSRRYVDSEPEFYTPEVWRKRAENVKQGSSEEQADLNPLSQEVVGMAYAPALRMYNSLLSDGVCPEQARMVLPQSMMTEWIWTGSLYGWANVYNQRKPGSHAQREVWPFAQSLADHMARLFPVSWEALTA
jgi:thymidylate synthase (FAD)